MSNSTNILILAAGGYVDADTSTFRYPVCLTEVNGKSIVEKILESTSGIVRANYIFAVLEEDCRSHHLDKVFSLLEPNARVVKLPSRTAGSACSALFSVCGLKDSESFLIISANELVDLSYHEMIDEFSAKSLDAGTVVFKSIHPRYSYVKLDSDGLVSESAQRAPISQHATAGVFWFAKVGDFVNASKSMIMKDGSVGDAFFIAPTFNELLLKQKRIGAYTIDSRRYIPLKTGQQIYKFEVGRPDEV